MCLSNALRKSEEYTKTNIIHRLTVKVDDDADAEEEENKADEDDDEEEGQPAVEAALAAGRLVRDDLNARRLAHVVLAVGVGLLAG